ncbi:MAG: membrane protein insertase YidC [Oscillospiraceae bacterium]|nr:membrane protein insertase YidC [Oscillospiraceae bacterium]
MFDFILEFFGKILLWIYNFCGSYALALILFTLLTKVVLFPLSYKGKRSMMQMNALQEEQARLQKQYGKDQQRYQMELSKLYEEQGVNPMGGCLWSLLPMPVLIGLYSVIRRPMRFMLCLSEESISTAMDAAADFGLVLTEGTSISYQEITLMSAMNHDSGLYNAVSSALGEAADKLQLISFDLFGLDLGSIPSWQFWKWDAFDWAHIGLFLIPIAITVLNYFYTQFSLKTNQIKNEVTEEEDAKKKKKKVDETPAANPNKGMMAVMPLMYLWFGYIMPAGMCVYMAASTVFSAVQDVIFSKFLNKRFAAEAAQRKAKIAEAREQEKAKKAEIAARRAAMEEELMKKGGKRAVKLAQKKNRDSAAGAIGVRRYARGRAYEADRYPTTPYRDPQDVLDEEALERALSKRGKKELVPEELPEIADLVETEEETETPDTQAQE